MRKEDPSANKGLSLKDLILMNISCIVGLTTLPLVAQFGYGSIFLFVLAILTFLIPAGIMIAELNTRMPETGGFYLWTRNAFGDMHGYIAAWCYWLASITWFPTILLILSSVVLYIFGDQYSYLEEEYSYNLIFCLLVLWGLTFLNILGIDKAKWVQNISGVANWLSIVLLVGFGFYYVVNYGSAHEYSASALIPDLTNLEILPYFAIAAFCFGGLELAPIMASEINDAKRNVPRALFISSIGVGLLYILGTVVLIVTIPEGDIDLRDGVAQSFNQISEVLKESWIGSLGAALLTLSTLGLFGAWLTGNARIPFVIGLDHYLPVYVGRIHKKWGSPYVSLLMQSVVISFLFLGAITGTTIKEAYILLLDMSVILYFIPFMYMFSSLIWHVKRNTGGSGLFPILGKRKEVLWTIFVLGFGITLLSAIVASLPSGDVESGWFFPLKVFGGTALLISAGLTVYFIKKHRYPADHSKKG